MNHSPNIIRRKLNTLLALPVLGLIRMYQDLLSDQLTARHCRFTPTCSEYAYRAVRRYGPIKGMRLARERLKRCNPDHEAGHDPVP